MTIGQQIKSLREAGGLSQRSLATQLGVSNESVSGWESGKFTPAPEMVAKVAKVLGAGLALVQPASNNGTAA